MTIDRRQMLGALGVGSASTLLWALGCGARPPTVRRAPQVSGEVRTWLHDAVTRLAAVYPTVHALAVSRRRTAAALDVLGAGLARERHDGVVLTVRDRDGACRESMTSDLTESGVAAAATALGASRRRAAPDFGPTPDVPIEPPPLDVTDLYHRVELLQRDATVSSRIVYAAALVDVDDAVVWSVAPGRDLEQRLVRIRQSATRAAWNGARPVAGEIEHAWSGWLDDQPLTATDLAAASATALELMTPGGFDDGERTVVLDPSVAASLLDATTRYLLTASPNITARADTGSRGNRTAPDARPDATRPDTAPRTDGTTGTPDTATRTRSTTGTPDTATRTSGITATPDAARIASTLVTLIDDPTAAGAYGKFAFDDEGEPAAPLTLIDNGVVAAHLADHAAGGTGRGRRPGHLAPVEPAASHLQLVPGIAPPRALHGDGLLLEGGQPATFDPATGRIRIPCARARELSAGNATGRVWADVELVSTLSALLAAIDGIANAPTSFSLRGPTGSPRGPSFDAPPLWRSISTPAIRTRGLVRARGNQS